MRISNLLTLLVCLTWTGGMAQPTYKASLPAVPTDAFYAINLPYGVLGGACSDLRDIRIRERGGKEVAWLLQEDAESISSHEFVSLPIRISSLSKRTEVLITQTGRAISSLVLKIKNTDVHKESRLLGSNDGSQWFAVKDRLLLNKIGRSDQTEDYIPLDFPLSDYTYYKLVLNDSLSAPLNIIGVGEIKRESRYRRHLLEVPLTMSPITTKAKQSVIELLFPFLFKLERIDLYISAPRYYNRLVELQPRSSYGSSTLTHENGSPQSVSLDVYCDRLKLSIHNGDDEPLTIDSIKAYTRKYRLVAELKAGVNYTLTYGDALASFPTYDLSFSKQLPDSLTELSVGAIEQLPTTAQPEEAWWLPLLKTYGIWIVIILVIVQILFLVRKITNKEGAPDE